jgi:capsular polysaccharide biosynthesis protein
MIMAVAFLSTSVSGILSYFVLSPVYESNVSLIVGKAQDNKLDSQYQYSDVLMYQQMVKTYAEIAKSKAVAEKSAEKVNHIKPVDAIQNMMSVNPQPNTQIINIKIRDNNADAAARIANSVADSLIEVSGSLYPVGSIKVVDRASIPVSPVKPRPLFNASIAFFAGIIVSLGIVFVIDYMDNTIKTSEDIEKYIEIPVIGVIPMHANNR